MGSKPSCLRTSIFFSLIAVTICPGLANAGGVKDVVRDLYGGDGITLADVGPPFSHVAHFTAASFQGLDELNTALASGAGNLAFNSAVTGFAFDIERGLPVRITESLGPLLAERAPTIGRGKLNVAFTYTRIDYDRFEGTDLDDLSLIFQHEDVNGDGVLGPPGTPLDFELDEVSVDIDLDFTQDIFALFGTYGLTRNWDVGVVIPIIHSDARAVGVATIVDNAIASPGRHQFDPVNQDAPVSVVDRDATGIGDVIVRTKYNFLRKHARVPDLAVVAQVKLATGDENDLLGTGETDVVGLFVASKRVGKFTPHVNLGYEWSTDSELSNVRYVVGFDATAHPRLSLAAELLGRWEPNGDGIGDSIIDLAVGGKWNPVGTLVFGANARFPLNKDEGLRSDVIWTLGVESTF